MDFFCRFRNVVYNLSIYDFTEQRRLVWYSPENDVKMCVVKGKDDVSIISSLLLDKYFRFNGQVVEKSGSRMWNKEDVT